LTQQILHDSRRVVQEVEALPPRRRSSVRGLGERLETNQLAKLVGLPRLTFTNGGSTSRYRFTKRSEIRFYPK
jgi:hypothetical protein